MSDSEEPRDEAAPDTINIEGPEATEEADSEFSPFDEVDEEFKPGPDVRVTGPDGLPLTVDQTAESDIPSLSTTTLVCMGDYSLFVLRHHWRETVGFFEPPLVERAPDGRYRVALDVVLERMKLRIEQHRKLFEKLRGEFSAADRSGALAEQKLSDIQVLSALLARPGELHGFDPQWIVVEPLRPPCQHYVRQKTSFHLNARYQLFVRLCSARRTTEGTFMTVRDTGMWACDMRFPFDSESVKALDEFDQTKIEQGKTVKRLPMFGGGIFESKGRDP